VHNLKRKKALDHWKNNATRRVIQRARLQIQTIEEGNLQIENENLEASAENKSKGQAVSSLKKKFNGRVFKKFLKRRLSQALNRWRDHVQGMNNGFDKQNVLLSKMRSRLLRESFEIYKTTYLKSISY
jgi:ABC-type phosphate transport system auxiliary subunit